MKDEVRREIVMRLRESSKYRDLSEDALRRIADWAAVRHQAPREAVKAAKRKLHQVYGAYLSPDGLSGVEALVRALPPSAPEEALRETCLKVLALHASTAERVPILGDFYGALFREIGRPGSILDLACGLSPFALPWMGLASETEYRAVDLDHRLISAVNDFLGRMGRPPTALCGDILTSPPEGRADVVFLLKAVPCLEQQEKGAGGRLLRGLRARWAVVSFPARTLGGRDRGMGQYYDRFMARTVGELGIAARKMEYPNEVFYVCDMV